MKLSGPIWLMQPIPYFGEKLKGEWIIEPKIDGWRMQIIKYSNGKVECWGRRLEKRADWSEKLPFITQAIKAIPKGTVLDCELFSNKGRRFIPSLFSKKPKVKPLVYLFDIIYFQNKFVGNLELKERRKIIEKLAIKPPIYLLKQTPLDMSNPPWQDIKILLNLSVYKKTTGKLASVRAKQKFPIKAAKGFEGIVIKNLVSKYQVGKESQLATAEWRKIKWR